MRSTRAPRPWHPRRSRTAPRRDTRAGPSSPRRRAPRPRARAHRRAPAPTSRSRGATACGGCRWRRTRACRSGTRNPRMPSSVCAQITARSAIEPFVIHIFEPFSTQSPPSRLADVRMWFGSLPKSASVSPKHPITSPVAILGQPALLLLLGAEPPDREHAERPLDAHERAEARIARLELQAREPVADRVRAQTSVALEVHAQEPERAELERDLLRERPRLEPRRRCPGRTFSPTHSRTRSRTCRSSSESRWSISRKSSGSGAIMGS